MWISSELRERDLAILKGHKIQYKPYFNLIPGEISGSSSFFYRTRKRLSSELVRIGIELPYAISYAPDLMYNAALKEDADLYVAHLECAFYAGRKLAIAGKKVAFDFEDWYSRDYLLPGRPVKLLRSLEKSALTEGVYCVAASKSMAEAIKKSCGINTDVTVVYNGFSSDENIDAA